LREGEEKAVEREGGGEIINREDENAKKSAGDS
jgi:hypothetical protein